MTFDAVLVLNRRFNQQLLKPMNSWIIYATLSQYETYLFKIPSSVWPGTIFPRSPTSGSIDSVEVFTRGLISEIGLEGEQITNFVFLRSKISTKNHEWPPR